MCVCARWRRPKSRVKSQSTRDAKQHETRQNKTNRQIKQKKNTCKRAIGLRAGCDRHITRCLPFSHTHTHTYMCTLEPACVWSSSNVQDKSMLSSSVSGLPLPSSLQLRRCGNTRARTDGTISTNRKSVVTIMVGGAHSGSVATWKFNSR